MKARKWGLRRGPSVAGALAVGLVVAGHVLAQTAGQIVQPNYVPPSQRASGSVVFSGKPGLKAPPGSEKLSIQISGVTVDGTLPGMQPATSALVKRLTGGRIAVSEIFAAASDLEAAYAQAGYVLARVVIPAQRLRDGGKLRITVVDGFVEKIDTSNVPPKLRGRLLALTKPLVGKRGLTRRELERRVLLAGDTYGIALGSALASGATPGGTVIVLQPAFRSITGFANLDNSYAGDLGTWSLSGGLEFNNYLGHGESFYIRGSGNPNGGDRGFFGTYPRLRTLALGAVTPIGTSGLTFNIEATDSRATPDDPVASSNSTYRRLSFRLYYPWRRSRDLNVSSRLTLDLIKDRQDLLTGSGTLPIYQDQLSVLRLATDFSWLPNDKTAVEGGVVLSGGLDAFGVRTAADVASSGVPMSNNADPQFQKIEISARYRRQLSDRLVLSLAGQAQTSFGQTLPSSEQFGIATVQNLSAFDTGTLTGDSGWVTRAELSTPKKIDSSYGPFIGRPYVFGATGAVILANPTVNEEKRINASAFGLGLEVTRIEDPRFSSATVRAEISRGTRNDGTKAENRFTLVASYRF